MNVGYAFWGFLGDRKYDKHGKQISTPDGNAFYSWSIIKAFQEAGDIMYSMMPDRDSVGWAKEKENIFESWCMNERKAAYTNLIDLFGNGSGYKGGFYLNNSENINLILLEWRWEIPGRNELSLEGKEDWQPDLKIRDDIIKFARVNRIPLVVFDLDYKLTKEDIEKYGIEYVIELGNKWENSRFVKSKKVFIPFDFNHIDEFNVKRIMHKNLVYVGNRYERDWCIDKYIPEDMEDVMIYGNWKESGRDSEERWKKLNFGDRIQTSQMRDIYSDSIATILLAKQEYCDHGFMTARLVEAIFYGTVPLFIEEYGRGLIQTFAGMYAESLTVRSKNDVKVLVGTLKSNVLIRERIIKYLRMHLRFMDCKFFVNDVKSLIKE